MRLLILSSGLSISALIRKASAPKSYTQMETLLVKTANGDDYDAEFLKHHTAKMLIQGRYLGS